MKDNCIGNAVWIGIATVILVYMTGCGQILGIREVDAWGLKIQYAEGIDFGVGMNSVDNVENKRGINPLPKYGEGAVRK